MNDSFTIRPIESNDEMQKVRQLTCRNYCAEGYTRCNVHPGQNHGECEGFIHFNKRYDTQSPQNSILGAFSSSGGLVGTISCTSSEYGKVPLGENFPEVLEKIKKPHTQLWRYEVHHEARKALVGKKLLYAATLWALEKGSKFIFGEINPEHLSTYRCFGFVKVEEKNENMLINAPVTLIKMPLDIEDPTPLLRFALKSSHGE